MKNKFLLFSAALLLGVATLHAAPQIGVQTRRELAQMLSRILAREVVGGNVKIEAVKIDRNKVQIYTSKELSYYPFREENTAAMYDSVRMLLPQEFRKSVLELYTDTREIRRLIPMAFREASPLAVSAKGKKSKKSKKGKTLHDIPFVNPSEHPLVTRLSSAVEPSQGLSGRHIALWQSHGRYFDQAQNCWKWQRVQLWETCEDLYTQSYVLPYLVPMLENAGANVLLPRERDVQKQEVLADNDAPEQYQETNGEQLWQAGGVGFAHLRSTYVTGQNPFRDGTTRRVSTATGDAAASRAVWRAEIPQKGEYAVYVSYESTPNSTSDAEYTVHHAGGESRFAVNQTMGGGTWIYLGHFLFGVGEQEVVSLTNRSQKSGRLVSADAVKIGGGFGNVARTVDKPVSKELDYTLETSGYPRFCEGSRYWLQWAGFDPKVYTPKENTDDYKDDFMSRAHWVNALMGGSQRLPDSVGLRIPIDMALAFHSDAGVRPGDEIVGTLGIFYTKDKDTKGRFAGGADRYRSRDLTDIVQTQIVSDIRRTFEPDWNRRGLWNRSYYEARVPGVPTMLLELLSHQNFADMRLGSDPRFKFLVSRAVYKGILRFVSSQYGTPYIVQPLPVEAFSATFEGDQVRLRWTPVVDSLETTAAPTGYVVYTRVDDGGFDNGRRVESPTLLVEQNPGSIYSYKVTATNEGGESFPSEVLAAFRAPKSNGSLLIVNGFDRVSAPVSAACDSLAGFYRDIDGGVPDKCDIAFIGGQRIYDRSMAKCEDDKLALGACYSDYETDVIGGNTFDYPYLHGRSAAEAGYSFCSASVKAVERGEVPLSDYRVVDLILGKQRTTTLGRGVLGPEFRTFTPELQNALRMFAAAGGGLFVSGSYVASDLCASAGMTDADREFARDVLWVECEGSQAVEQGRVRVVDSRAGLRSGEYRFHDDLGPDHYLVEASDVLKPAGRGAFAVMRYLGDGRGAGVASAEGGRSLVMGFPFESLTTDAQRDRLMRDVLKFLFNEK